MIIYKCDLCGKEIKSGDVIEKGLPYMYCGEYVQLKNFDLCKECFKKYEKTKNLAIIKFIEEKQKKVGEIEL